MNQEVHVRASADEILRGFIGTEIQDVLAAGPGKETKLLAAGIGFFFGLWLPGHRRLLIFAFKFSLCVSTSSYSMCKN